MDLSFITNFADITFLGKELSLWSVFFTIVTALVVFDLGVFNRKDHIIGFIESLRLTGMYVVFGLLFGLWVWYESGAAVGIEYYTVYLLEQSLSLDNLFVMSVIFSSFSVPREYQRRVLLWGIIGVVVLRGIMIGVGTVAVQHYSWILFFFAAILMYTGVKMMFLGDAEKEDFREKSYVKFLTRHLRLVDSFHGHQFFVKEKKEDSEKSFWYATPLFLVLCVIELTDVMFAFDSVPAALAITNNSYVLLTANVFAILGLRAMFFAMEHVLHRFAYLKYSLSIVLVFIGAKVFYAHIFDVKIPGLVSLGITVTVLILGVLVSIIRTSHKKASEQIK